MATVDRSSPFVGRVNDLAELTARMGGARAGSGGFVLVSGPAGIGKTRIVEEAAAIASGIDVRWGRAVDDPGAPPFWPWRRVFRGLPAVHAAVAEALAQFDRAARTADADAARFRFMAAATEALLRSAEPAGLVVVLEDLHWADEASLRLLRHVVTEVRESHLVLVGTLRDPSGSVDRPLSGTLAELLRAPGSESIGLHPLGEAEVGAYLAALEHKPVDAARVRLVHRRSGGNPLYLRAISRSTAASAHTSGVADGGENTDGGDVADLQHLVRAAVSVLGPSTVDLLAVAAVLGEEIDAAVLTAVSALDEAAVVRALDTAVRAGVLTTAPYAPGVRRFAHAIVRDSIYADLDPSVREALHRRAAAAVEQTTTDESGAGVIAGHLLRSATDPPTLRRAAGWARRAAAAATRSLAFEEATRFSLMALRALTRAQAGADERAEVLVELATAEFRTGRFGNSLEHAAQASDAAQSAGRDDLVAAAALVVRDVASPDFVVTIVHLCERALAAVDAGHAPATRSRLLSQLASALADTADFAQASELADRALTLAQESADPLATIEAVQARVKANAFSLELAERRRLGALAVELAGTTGQPLAALWGHKWRIDAALEIGDLASVDSELRQVSALAELTRLPMVRWHDLRLRASVGALRGQFATASRLNEEALDLARSEMRQDLSAAGMSYAFWLQLGYVTGDVSRWSSDMLTALEVGPDIPIVRVSRAVTLLLSGRRDEAAAAYDEIRALAATPEFSTLSQGVPLYMTPLIQEFEDAATARVMRDVLAAHPIAAGGAGVYCTGSTARQLGCLALVMGELDDAIGHLQEALATNLRTGARPEVVLTRVDLARALERRARHGDAALAQGLARQALLDARQLGMPGSVRAATTVLERTRTADPLSSREREIARLVADAMTNRQIAERLVLSERTVESHVRSILAKLGVANRTEIATATMRSARGG